MIELQHLTKRFATQGGTVVALNDINLTIRDGDVYGMNIDATNHNANSAFWKRTLSTRDSGLSANGHRKFSPRGYLFPISQEEMDRTDCTQNYGW
jgi:hypothetical protein